MGVEPLARTSRVASIHEDNGDNGMASSTPMQGEHEPEAMMLGIGLALDIFGVWRGKGDGVDALILLAITRSNVDGILYSEELRRRFGGATPIAPDDLRQPVSIAVLAISLGLRPSAVSRRVAALAARNECDVTADGMLITERQVAASDRLEVVTEIYELLRDAWSRQTRLGLFPLTRLPLLQAASPRPLRSAGAHAAKYVLRLVATASRGVGGDAIDGLLMLRLIRADGPVAVRAIGADLGLTSRLLNRRLRGLTAAGFCRRTGRGEVAVVIDDDWSLMAGRQNMKHLYQLLAGLAEVGALLDFSHGPDGARPPDGPTKRV